MMRMVVCIKLKQNLEGLESQPFPGELGKRIFNEVSKVAWKEWLEK
ncbi:MAG: oxidative damage protection protein, partial [Proteobacteria bacterium]|nr:oxidative damage protection protein [Pseudomonadota bacterium]